MAIQIKVRPDAERYVRAVVQECTGEVGGWGYLRRNDKGEFVIYKFVVLPQEASSGGVDFDDEGQHAEMQRAMEAGEIDNLRVSWHSHGSMSTFYSNTDEEAIAKYKSTGIPYIISLVYNRKGEVRPRVDIFDSEVVGHIQFEGTGVDYVVELHERPKDPIELKAEADVQRNVRTRSYGGYTGGRHYLTMDEAKKQGLCFMCDGEGRRHRYKDGEWRDHDCDRCDGTGLSGEKIQEAKRKQNTKQIFAQARSKATRRYNKRLKREAAEDEAAWDDYLDPTGEGSASSEEDRQVARWLDPGVSLHELTEEEWTAMCEHYNLDPDDPLIEQPSNNGQQEIEVDGVTYMSDRRKESER